MFSKVLDLKKEKSIFQVLFLRNDPSQAVEVHEVDEVDFSTIQASLENGDSVFITSNRSQKISHSEPNVPNRLRTKLVRSFRFGPV
jgi:hypothetical protein